jgi:hypothetical protein
MKNTHLFFAILLLFLAVACAIQDETTTPLVYPTINTTSGICPETLPTAMPMPDFLQFIYPTNSITKDEYEKTLTDPALKGIHITVSANGLNNSVLKSADSEYRSDAISKRIQLFVDETLIPNATSTMLDGLVAWGPFYLSWPINLNTGFHKAKLIFDLDTGETVNYEWAFCILP